jgi:sugar phosphate isomerase/epimerase
MEIERRQFLRAAAASALACVASHGSHAAETEEKRKLADIGIIGGVPKDAAGDWQKSLRHMAEIGYTQLEGRPRGDVDGYLKFLKEIGLTLVSCGVDFGKKLKPDWLDVAKASKARYATIFWPWFYAPATITVPQVKEIADQLNKCGEHAKAAGLKLAVHNHDRDFRILEGKPVFDHLLEMTKPELVAVELDIYWAVKAGVDPLEYFKRYPGRFELFHVKDMDKTPEKLQAAVGSGTIDFARIFDKSEQAGVKHYIVELEGPCANTKGAEDSVRYLKELRF